MKTTLIVIATHLACGAVWSAPACAQELEFVEVATAEHDWTVILSAWIGPDRTAWVADPPAGRLLAWDAAGELRGHFGSSGPGPSEFGAPIAGFESNGVRLVVDATFGIKRLTRDGSLLAATRLPPSLGTPRSAHLLGDELLLEVRGRTGPALVTEEGDVVHLWDDLDDAPLLYAPIWDVSAGGRLMVSAADERYTLWIWDRKLETSVIIDLPPVEKPIAAEVRSSMEQALGDLPKELRPLIPRLAPTLAGALWYGESSVVTLVERRRGDHIDVETRRIVGSVVWPEAVIPLDVRGGLAVGVRVGELDVPTLVIMQVEETR